MIKIEKYTENYLEKFTKLFNQWEVPREYSAEELKKGIEDSRERGGNTLIIAIDDKDNLAGYALFGENYHIGFEPFIEIWQIIVDKEMRGEGIGKELVLYIENYAKDKKIPKLKLSSQCHRERAHKFYKELGFKVFKESHFFEKSI